MTVIPRMARRPAALRTLCAVASAIGLSVASAPGPAAAQSTRDAELDAQIRAGLQRLSARDYPGAIKEFKAADKRAGGACADCQIGLAKVYNASGEEKNAIKSADAALKLTTDPKLVGIAQNERGLALLATANGNHEKLEAAMSSFKTAYELTGGKSVQFNLGVTLLKLERDEEGVALLREHLEKHPDSPYAESARDLVANPLRARKTILPNLQMVTLKGETITGDGLLGKVVLLDFWGTWCGPCRQAVPSLKDLAKRMEGAEFVLVSVGTDAERETLEKFVVDNEMNWPQVHDGEHAITERLGIESYPTYLLVAPDGEIVFVESGWSERIDREVATRVGRAVKKAEKSAKAPG